MSLTETIDHYRKEAELLASRIALWETGEFRVTENGVDVSAQHLADLRRWKDEIFRIVGMLEDERDGRPRKVPPNI